MTRFLNALRHWAQRWRNRRAKNTPAPYTPPPPLTEPIPQEELEWLAEQYNKHGGLETVWMHKPDVLQEIQKEYRKRFPPKATEPSKNNDDRQTP